MRILRTSIGFQLVLRADRFRERSLRSEAGDRRRHFEQPSNVREFDAAIEKFEEAEGARVR